MEAGAVAENLEARISRLQREAEVLRAERDVLRLQREIDISRVAEIQHNEPVSRVLNGPSILDPLPSYQEAVQVGRIS